MGLSKGGKFHEEGMAERELKEVIMQNAVNWQKLTDGGFVEISINTRYVISLKTNFTRRTGAEDIPKSNPRDSSWRGV
jgi:hypothetical protein